MTALLRRKMLPALIAVGLCAIAACGGSPKPAAPVVEPAVDEHKAERDAKSLVNEIYASIGRGKTDSLFALLSDRLVAFGPRGMDAMVTRADALVALTKVVDPKAKKHAAVRSSGLDIVASRGGHSAWAFDVVSVEGQRLAVTAVLSNTDDLWAVCAAAVAEMPSGKQVKAEAARDAIVPPGAAMAAKLDPRASAAVEKFKRGLLDQRLWGDELAASSDAIIVGPTAGDVTRGKQAIKRAWKARLRSNVREATSGEVSGAMTADGQLVWLSVPVTRVADDEDPMPLRIFTVYERDGADWKMTALHEALAFGEPGSGTPFKKILPPAPPPPPEPAKAASTDARSDAKPADAAPKKKAKKKARPIP
jgi:ketosteroid isomerase-like protein